MPINAKKENLFFFSIGLAAVFFYTYIIYRHAINMPKWDDFPDILQFMDRWLQADNFLEKISVFFYHTNEHILLVNHIVILAQYYLIGHLDFRWLIYIGNLFYAGIALLLWLPFKGREDSAFTFAMLLLVLVTFYPYESTLWAMTAISNQAVIFFSLLTLWYVTQPSPSMLRTIPLASLAIFSQSNGMFLLPLVGIYLFFHHRKKLKTWLIFSTIILTCYLLFMNPASQADTSIRWADIPLLHYLMAAPVFIATFGSMLFNEINLPAFIIAFLLGAIIFSFSLKALLARQHPPFIFYSLLFFILCIASIAFYRGLVAGPSVAFISRYKMYSCCFLAVGLLLNPQWLTLYKTSLRLRYGTLLAGILFFAASFYLNLPKAKLIDGHLRESLEYWVEDGDFRRGKGFFIKDSDTYLFAALHNGTWSPMALVEPDRIINDIEVLSSCPLAASVVDTETPLPLRIKHTNRNAPAIQLEILSAGPLPTTPWIIYLCSPTVWYRLHFTPRQDTQGNYPVYYIPAAQIAPENYHFYIQYDDQLLISSETLLRKPHTR